MLYLRSVQDSDRIKETFGTASRIAVIGGGWIGLETAAAARAAGVEVTVLEASELPLLRVLGREVAQVFADLHREHGVDLRANVGIRRSPARTERPPASASPTAAPSRPTRSSSGSASRPTASSPRRRASIPTTASGSTRSCDPRDPDIYAAGDVANALHPLLGKHIRVEHWANALNQPQVAAKAMLGQDAVYDRVPYFFTDQYDLGMEYAGYVGPDGYDEVVFRGRPRPGVSSSRSGSATKAACWPA